MFPFESYRAHSYKLHFTVELINIELFIEMKGGTHEEIFVNFNKHFILWMGNINNSQNSKKQKNRKIF